MLGKTTNLMLEKAEEGIQAKVKPAMQANLSKVVHAGLTIMYSPQMADARNKHLNEVTDFAAEAGKGSSRMIYNLYLQSKKKMPLDIVVPACMIFAFEYLDLIEKAGKIKVTPDVIAKATQSVSDAVLPMFGITPDKMNKLVQQSQQKQGQTPPKPQGIISGAQGVA
jgi:hypothetical protein